MTTYRADLKKDIYFTLICMILLGMAIIFSLRFSIAACIFVSGFLSIMLLVNVFSNRLIQIQLNPLSNRLIMFYGNYLEVKEPKYFELHEIEFTYKRQAISFRGGVKNVCSIYRADEKIAVLIPAKDGWDDDEIYRFVYGLIDAGVRKKFVGHILKDVKI